MSSYRLTENGSRMPQYMCCRSEHKPQPLNNWVRLTCPPSLLQSSDLPQAGHQLPILLHFNQITASSYTVFTNEDARDLQQQRIGTVKEPRHLPSVAHHAKLTNSFTIF